MSNYAATILADSPQSFWTFDVASTKTAVDAGTLSNNGTYQHSPDLSQPGIPGAGGVSCVTLDGTTQYVSIPNDAAYSQATTGTISVEWWMFLTTLDFPKTSSGFVHALGKGASATGYEWSFRVHGNASTRPNRVQFVASSSDQSLNTFASGDGVAKAGQWIHIVGVLTATQAKVYANGSFVAQANLTFTPTVTATAPRLGSRDGSTFLLGSLDEVAIYNYELSASQVLAHYNAGVGAQPIGFPITATAARLPDVTGPNVAVIAAPSNRVPVYLGDATVTSAGGGNVFTELNPGEGIETDISDTNQFYAAANGTASIHVGKGGTTPSKLRWVITSSALSNMRAIDDATCAHFFNSPLTYIGGSITGTNNAVPTGWASTPYLSYKSYANLYLDLTGTPPPDWAAPTVNGTQTSPSSGAWTLAVSDTSQIAPSGTITFDGQLLTYTSTTRQSIAVSSGGYSHTYPAGSAAVLVSNYPLDPNVTWFMYDDENWNLTPPVEQNHWDVYMPKAVALAHMAGVHIINAPARDLMAVKPGNQWYIDGTKYQLAGESFETAYLRTQVSATPAGSDWFHVQSQRDELNLGLFTSFTQGAATEIRTVSPQTIVTAGLTTIAFPTTAQQLVDAFNAVVNITGGFWLNVSSANTGYQVAVQFLQLLKAAGY